ncbi:MAG TPA: acyltransferase [Acidimicrobiales bacterium]|nr:acyltransferase [Acidimicrobiales bacterium]
MGRVVSRWRHVAGRIAANGVADLSLGLWVRRRATAAGVLKVTPGLPLPKLVNHGGRIDLSDCRLYPGVRIECWDDAVVQIGKGTYLNRNTEIVAFGSVAIGRDCKIARDVLIMDTDQHPVGSAPLQVRPVRIEDGAWIGSRALILKGVTVGRESVVGAGAIVTKDVPPFSVVAGPAARVIRTLAADLAPAGDSA